MSPGSVRPKAAPRFARPSADASVEVAHHTIELRDGALRMVVVADTHGSPHPDWESRISAEAPDCIVHAGDIGDLRVLTGLEKIAPLHAIRGNIDAPVAEIPEALTLDLVRSGRALLRILLVHIGVFGAKLRGEVAALARREGAALVICGHSHVPFIGSDRGISIFNPGSIGPRRFQLPIVYGVLRLENGRVRMWHVDCETGKTWEP